ncbi:MAG: hypothetical protein Q8J97_13670, partial [Flavobacteriaceae bacterium]|nr:hypothetical protein [Flavobacteriaceae bacterium]
MQSRYPSNPSLREVSNVTFDPKDRLRTLAADSRVPGPFSARTSSSTFELMPPAPTMMRHVDAPASPRVDEAHLDDPARCADIAADIVEMFLVREKQIPRDPQYLRNHREINEKMRTILVDWLVDVHLKFKLHEETFFLAVDIVDRYLTTTRVQRAQLQLVGITAVLLAAKYEEIWPPEVKDCVHISAKTYKEDEILRMERAICAALQFKFTVPTPFAFLARLLEVTEADELTKNASF